MDEPLLPTPTSGDSSQSGHRQEERSEASHDGTTLSDWARGRTSASFPGSAGSTGPSRPSGTPASARSRSTDPAQMSLLDTGPTSPDGPMSTGSPLLPTPNGMTQTGGQDVRGNLHEWVADRLYPTTLPTPSAESYGTNQGGGMGRVGPVRPSLDHMMRHGLTSSSGDSPASQPATPARGRASATIAGSGRSTPALLGSCDRAWFYSKTYLDFVRWEESGMPRLTDAYVAGLIDGEGCIGICLANEGVA